MAYHGQGVKTKTSGERIEGDWDDGTRYEGGFRYGMYHGQGVYTGKSGNRHEGDWPKGVFNGGRIHVAGRAARHVLPW